METKNRVAVVTGAGGTLCSAMAIDLATQGYKVVLVGRSMDKLKVTEELIKAQGGICVCLTADVKNLEQVKTLRREVLRVYGRCSVLINGAGGNQPDAVTTINHYDPAELTEKHTERGFFNLDMDRFHDVINVNIMGTVIPCQEFARDMIEEGGGVIINFASMNTYRPLSRIPAYALSKAGISNFTQWLAAYLAPAHIRVNAIAPGFFLNDRSRKLLLTADGGYSERGANIIRQTPMKKFGEASELLGCMNWLIDDEKASFVTGITVPIDGGFLSDAGL
ncbi:SDR family NAD(P)-dependent oxidoreductase [Bacteroides sp.]|uniref:SDR family NAD(P)-dependent oxidoreductase n=1 Tax=Bacteroides sp. TaxID=29523 RepID=UPI002605AE6B|nr:SDR family NAD(P)-dependent oxidoreductase [Bacteroides sp.]